MFKVIVGFILGFILSDVITSKVPEVGKYKILPGPQLLTSPKVSGLGFTGPINAIISKHGIPQSFLITSRGRAILKKGGIL